MRWCSRCAGPVGSACFGGSFRLAWRSRRLRSEQAPTMTASAATGAQRHRPFDRLEAPPRAITSVSLDDLDLLRPRRLDPRAAALLDIAADPDTTPFQAL